MYSAKAMYKTGKNICKTIPDKGSISRIPKKTAIIDQKKSNLNNR